MNLGKKNNYLAISNALLTITMLSNNFNDELDRDTTKIIEFIASSFSIEKEDAELCEKLILDDLTMISTTSDVYAFYNNSGVNEFKEIGNMLYLKAETINRLESIADRLKGTSYLHFFDFKQLRPYYSDIRYKELELSSAKGDIDINRTVAILQAIGIGCQRNLQKATNRLKQCAIWGDIPSLFYLAHIYELEGKEKEAQIYKDLSALSEYIIEGKTMLSKEDKEKYSKETCELFVIISSIKQDIVLGFDLSEINYSFAEVMLLDSLDYYTKLDCINNYKSLEWKNITNSSNDPTKKLGFVVKGDK